MIFESIVILGVELMLVLVTGQMNLLILFLIGNTFFLLYHLNLEYKKAARQATERNAELSFKIANQTLPYLRRGLNEQNAEYIAKIIQEIGQVAAVSITDCEKQLAYLGVGCDQHHPGDKILTRATRDVIQSGVYKIVRTQKELNCPRQNVCDCPLAAAVIVPLKCQGEVVGTMKLYETKDGQLSSDLIRLALGMADLLGIQIELAELDHQAKLAAEAQLNALQAQINPHFFFNVLNTIIATSRTSPNRSRRLLIHLAEFFRKALKSHGSLITLREEMSFVKTYLILEKARFGRKLHFKGEIPEELMDALVPRLSVQPLVENAVKHGITEKIGNGVVSVKVEQKGQELYIIVGDDGVGIQPERLQEVLKPGVGSGNGVGMANVHERLIGHYGEEYGLQIESQPNIGTTVTMHLPLTTMEDEDMLERA
ncbi:histidine kinase [Desulfitobacterium chlororespirans]|uniref:histidine kinase n=1 Tax=Desulfitobacterium chlororespirans DSM 11544 TaxID=1121395 RepID=A0A1M7T414_9FIRM|nr:histidine kinase [Desulfitobacterium chlororespirans]SHN65417.1 signal transduction histidine kinase, LytS [Desulfitobacterium chlororespirans DSM 11544]